MENKIDFVYILAPSHSGSTLLAMLLNAHPEVASIGECSPGALGSLESYRCACRELIMECPFWKEVTQVMTRRYSDFDLSRLGLRQEWTSSRLLRRVLRAEHRGPLLEGLRDVILACTPTWRRGFADVAGRCDTLVRSVLSITGAKLFVDSTKLAHVLKFVLRVPSFNVRVIHLVRDGRAVALTYTDPVNFADASDVHLRKGGRGLGGPTIESKIPMSEAADEWRRCMRSAEFALKCLDRSQWIRVHYETLCSDPEDTVARILDFVGADPSLWNKDFRAAPQHIVGNGMRLDSSSEIRLDERWKEALGEQELHEFDAVAGDVNRRYGYL